MLRMSLIIVVTWIVADRAVAQVVQQQTVQLPTLHYFGVSTTVVAPTRGTVPLGGVTRSGRMRTRFDKVGPRGAAYGSLRESASLQTEVTVIDHHEIDRQLLAEAARRRGANVDVMGRPVDKTPLAGQSVVPPEVLGRSREKVGGEVYLRRGRDAELAGQPEVAKVFYRRAEKLGNAVERRTAGQRLAALNGDDVK